MRCAKLALVLAVAVILGGCGAGPDAASPPSTPAPTPAPTPRAFLLVGDGVDTVSASMVTYGIEGDGSLSGRSATHVEKGTPRVVDRTGRFLFAVVNVTPGCCRSDQLTDLLTYELAPTGELALSTRSYVPSDAGVGAPVATSRFLYLFLPTMYVPVTPRPAGPPFYDLYSGFYRRGFGDGKEGYTPTNEFLAVGAPVVSPSERTLYVVGLYGRPSSAAPGVGAYAVAPDGSLGFARSLDLPNVSASLPDQLSASLAVHPSGRLLYVSTQEFDYRSTPVPGTSRILGFATDDAGGMVGVLSLATTDFGPLIVHPGGRLLFQPHGTQIDEFLIDTATGALTPLRTVPLVVPSPLFAWTMDPAGRFLYGSGGFERQIWGYAIEASTGILTPLGSVAPGGYPLILVSQPAAP